MADNQAKANAQKPVAPAVVNQASKVSGMTMVSNTSMVNIRFNKRNSHQGISVPGNKSNDNFIGLPGMSTVPVSTEDFAWLKKHKAFNAMVDKGDIVINNSRMPNRQPSKVLSTPEVPNDLKNKKTTVAENLTPSGVTVQPLDNIEG